MYTKASKSYINFKKIAEIYMSMLPKQTTDKQFFLKQPAPVQQVYNTKKELKRKD